MYSILLKKKYTKDTYKNFCSVLPQISKQNSYSNSYNIKSTIFNSTIATLDPLIHKTSKNKTICVSIISEGIDVRKHISKNCIRYERNLSKWKSVKPLPLHFTPKKKVNVIQKESYSPYILKKSSFNNERSRNDRTNKLKKIYSSQYKKNTCVKNKLYRSEENLLILLTKTIKTNKKDFLTENLFKAITIENLSKKEINKMSLK